MRLILGISIVLVAQGACVVRAQHRVDPLATLPDLKLTVTVSTTCEAMVPAYCQGQFDFKMTADGAFLAGPDPNGRSVSGHLRHAESRALQNAGARMLAAIEPLSLECPVHPDIPGVMERVEVSAQGRTIVLRGRGGRLGRGCAPGNPKADARLFTMADRLMRHYYPKPF